MVTENVDIRFRESGARVVKRRIDEIGHAADRATRGIFLLQRAVFVLGGFGAVRALSTQVDMLTNVENRLRLTTNSAQELEAVQTRLFQVARDSRTAFESVAEIYNRTALSVRELGIGAEETARFTESLAKASILSGASTREANAALIQLSQGLASNRLSGDELRSVLEQLPFVADVIARHMGITRGELREFGREGKISAEVVLEAFRGASDEIDRLFDQTTPTISQALSVLNNAWLQFLDNVDDATSISGRLANAIILVADNIDVVIASIATLGAIWAATFAVNQLRILTNFIGGFTTLGVKAARLVEVENLRAAAHQRRAGAAAAAAAADTRAIQQGIVQLQQNRALLLQQQASIKIDSQRRIARDALTGRFIAYNAALQQNIRTNIALSQTERALATSRAQLATATATQTAATNTLAAANSRAAGAQAASAGLTARLTRTFPTLAGMVGVVANAVRGLWALLAANPIGAIVTVIGLLIAAFFRWGNQIKVTEDGVVGLKDAVIAAFQLMIEAVTPAANFIRDTIGGAITKVIEFFAGFADEAIAALKFIVEATYNAFTLIPRVIVGVIAGIIAAWDTLPGAAGAVIDAVVDFFVTGFENLANVGVQAVNKIIVALNSLAGTAVGDLLGFEGLSEVADVSLDHLRTSFGDGGSDAASAFQEGFSGAWNATSLESVAGAVGEALQPVGDAIIDRARQNLATAAEEAANSTLPGPTDPTNRPGSGSGSGSGRGSNDPDFNSIIAGMQQEIELLRLSNSERERAQEILKIEEQLKRSLTDAERQLADETLRQLDAARTQAEVLESIIGPREKIAEQQAALNALFQQGRIDINDYTVAIREMQAAADEASGTLAGGFRAAISNAIMSASQLGSALGDIVVGAADSAADAIVEFAKTGKLNIRQFFADLFAQITKLIAKQLILKALGFVFGVPLGGATGGGGLLGFNSGGSILPTGPGSSDSQVVSFAKRPDERVDILTPGQQAAQRNNMNGGGAPTVVQSPPVNVAAVLSSSDVVGAFDGDEGETVVINMIQRNASTVRNIVQG